MSLRWMKKAYQCANNNITRTIRGKPPIVPSNATDDDAEEYPLDEAYPLLLSPPPPLLGGRRIGLPALLWVRIDFIFHLLNQHQTNSSTSQPIIPFDLTIRGVMEGRPRNCEGPTAMKISNSTGRSRI